MRNCFYIVGLTAVLVLLGGCERTFERPEVMPPGLQADQGMCMFSAKKQAEVDVWVGAANAIVVGTVAEVSPVTDYYVTDVPEVESPLLSADQCEEFSPGEFTAFRVVLEDLEVLAGDLPERIEVRFGIWALNAISTERPTLTSNGIAWSHGAIETGMRIGGAVYEVNILETPFYSFETGAWQPFFVVGDDGGIWFQEVSPHACVSLIPPVDLFQGKSLSMLDRKVAAAAKDVSPDALAENPLREALGLNEEYSECTGMLKRWLGVCNPLGWEPEFWTE